MREAPEQIWLYVDTTDEGERYLELISEHACSQTDVEYIRADVHAARIAELERQLATKDAQITQMTAAWCEDAVKVEELTRQLAEAREVKPLEWDYREQQFGTYRADHYWINQSFGPDSYYFTTVRQTDGLTLYDGDDLEAAKAAAQADYTARILSALKGPTP